MKSAQEMSVMGELKFFFGLQLKQAKDHTYSIKPNMLENSFRSLT